MAIIKCKMCGGDVELSADKTLGMCDYCGSTMTLPKIDDDQRAAAFNRGNHFRRIGEFDKALAVYERIVREDDTDAEAHWCCALCRFGIEYVEDPATYEYLPTCHRASFDSFLDDVDYLAAVEHSAGITKRQYQKDGAKIAEVQRGILATSQNTEPYDVFICYKESDEQGNRTRDSLMAQDIYYQLTEQGRKVFFARITLEDVAGAQYEPYIFAALNSARVMIVVGTKAEHMNAVWVKNEWSRFLAMIKKDRHKLLLPCYRDMDPYDMPEALSVLQSYDMAKIGFIQDLTRGIAKVLDAEKKPEPVKETVVVQQAAAPASNTAPLLKRAFMFLEDGDWKSADEYCEKVLDIDPEDAQAYFGKLMSELRVRQQEDLNNQAMPFDDRSNYQKVLRFGDDKLKAELAGYIEHINIRNENARLDGIYTRAKNAMVQASAETSYKSTEATFRSISHYKDAAALADQCAEKALEAAAKVKKDAYDVLVEKIDDTYTEIGFQLLSEEFEQFGDHEDAAKFAAICLERARTTRKDAILARGKSTMSANLVTSYEAAIKLFESIPGWKDADEQIIVCQQKIEEIKAKAEADRLERERKAEADRLERVRKAEADRLERERIAKRNKKIAIITTPIVCAIIAFAIVLNTVIIPNGKYKDAIALMDAGKYSEAIAAFEAMDGYKDSAAQIAACETAIMDGKYTDAVALMDAGKYSEAIDAFEELNGHKDSADLIVECHYLDASALLDAKKYKEASAAFDALGGYKDAANQVLLIQEFLHEEDYQHAISLLEAKDYSNAYTVFESLGNYKDSATYLSSFVWKKTHADYKGYGLVNGMMQELHSEYTISYTYNNSGLLVAEEASTHNYRYEYEYDQNGLLVKKTRLNNWDAETQQYKDIYIEDYDKAGNVINLPTSSASYVCQFYQSGIVKQRMITYIDSSYSQTLVYWHDQDGKITRSETTRKYSNSKGTEKTIQEYTYDSYGNSSQAKVTRHDKNGKVTTTTVTYTNTYDANGNLLRHSSSTNTIAISEYTYDDHGNMLTYKTMNDKGVLYSSTEYFYDFVYISNAG